MENMIPKYKKAAYICPTCGVYAHMNWSQLFTERHQPTEFYQSMCAMCDVSNVWIRKIKSSSESLSPDEIYGELIYPDTGISEIPDDNMPDDVRKDYEEANSVFSKSPRAAAALLRLGLQKLCKHLGEPGKNINDDLRALSKKGTLSQSVIRVADTIRITGNQSVHPGEMVEADIDYIAEKMFGLLNIIVKYAITEPKELDKLYRMTPEGPRKSAEASDFAKKI